MSHPAPLAPQHSAEGAVEFGAQHDPGAESAANRSDRDAATGGAAEPWGADRSIRPVRSGTLRELLDAEFRRNHRFETLSSFFGDLRTLLRKAVVREEQTLGMERFLPDTPGREM